MFLIYQIVIQVVLQMLTTNVDHIIYNIIRPGVPLSTRKKNLESAVVGPHALMKHASVHPRRANYRDTKLSLANKLEPLE